MIKRELEVDAIFHLIMFVLEPIAPARIANAEPSSRVLTRLPMRTGATVRIAIAIATWAFIAALSGLF